MPLIKRLAKGSPLTAQEYDGNLDYFYRELQNIANISDLEALIQRVSSLEERLSGGENNIVAPSTIGSLPDRNLTKSSQTNNIDISGYFNNGGGTLSYSIDNPPSGVTINQNTGIITEDLNLLNITNGRNIVVRATNEVGSVSLAYTMIVTENVVIPGEGPILDWSVGNQVGGNIEITYEVSSDIIADVVISESSNFPGAENMASGFDHTGSPAPAKLKISLTSSGILDEVELPLIQGNFYFHVIPEGSENDEEGRTFGPVLIDSISPSLTNLSLIKSSQTSMTLSVDTSEPNNGTLHYGIWPAEYTVTQDVVISGEGSIFHVSEEPLSTNVKEINGLEEGVFYKAYAFQEDEAGNSSFVTGENSFIETETNVNLYWQPSVIDGTENNNDRSYTFNNLPNVSNREVIFLVSTGFDTGRLSDGVTWRDIGPLSISEDPSAIEYRPTSNAGGRAVTHALTTKASGSSLTVNIPASSIPEGSLKGLHIACLVVENGEVIFSDSKKQATISDLIFTNSANAGDIFVGIGTRTSSSSTTYFEPGELQERAVVGIADWLVSQIDVAKVPTDGDFTIRLKNNRDPSATVIQIREVS